jgi:hypothetical protein
VRAGEDRVIVVEDQGRVDVERGVLGQDRVEPVVVGAVLDGDELAEPPVSALRPSDHNGGAPVLQAGVADRAPKACSPGRGATT